jgi:2-polyprenyl-6-methoxyphenol hydroxylase-like FAD-dependent oxidoreductase
MAQSHIPVLIVGAGGAGLSLALMLHQQGIASVLVERRGDVAWYPRARNLNFRTLEVFRGLGLEREVIAAGAHFSQTFRKETLASQEQEGFPSLEQFLHIADHLEICTPEPAFWYCPQSRLEPLLLAEAKRRGCDVRYNTELTSFTQDSGGVSATISDRTTDTASVLQADYLLAADGAHSHVRKALGVKGEGLGVLDEHYIFVYFRAQWGELIRGYDNDAILIDRPGIRGFFLITDADRGMFAIQEEAAKDYSVERCKELVLDGLGKPDLPVEIVDVAHWQPAQLVAEHFGQGRVFLVGDAAHTMPPKLGLGVNTAIQSAQNLAWKLAAVLKGQASPDLLATYEAERHPVGRLAAEQSLVGPAASLLTKGSDDKLLPMEKRVPVFSLIAGYRYRSQAILSEDTPPLASPTLPNPTPQAGEGRARGEGGVGDAEIELLEKPEALAGQPGTRVPHLWLERGGQRISTLDLFDGRFVLLTGSAGASWQQAASAAAASLGLALSAYRVGVGGDLIDLENCWQAKMGVPAEGAVLVRPDGFVAWRTGAPPTNPEPVLRQVLATILGRSYTAKPEAEGHRKH